MFSNDVHNDIILRQIRLDRERAVLTSERTFAYPITMKSPSALLLCRLAQRPSVHARWCIECQWISAELARRTRGMHRFRYTLGWKTTRISLVPCFHECAVHHMHTVSGGAAQALRTTPLNITCYRPNPYSTPHPSPNPTPHPPWAQMMDCLPAHRPH